MFVHSLKLSNKHDWYSYSKSGLRPPDIPSNPQQVYEFQGFQGMGDWLGTGNIAAQHMDYLDYDQASKIVKRYKLKSVRSFYDIHSKELGKLKIPYKASKIYENKGWVSW